MFNEDKVYKYPYLKFREQRYDFNLHNILILNSGLIVDGILNWNLVKYTA